MPHDAQAVVFHRLRRARRHDYHSMERLCLVNVLFQPEKLDLRDYDLRALPGYHALFILEPAWRRRHRFNSRLRLTPQELTVLLGDVDNLEAELRTRADGGGRVGQCGAMRVVPHHIAPRDIADDVLDGIVGRQPAERVPEIFGQLGEFPKFWREKVSVAARPGRLSGFSSKYSQNGQRHDGIHGVNAPLGDDDHAAAALYFLSVNHIWAD